MALIECRECGKMISDKAKTCPHCGVSTELKMSEEKRHVTIIYNGAWLIFDLNIRLSVNGNVVGKYSFKKGFTVKIPITSEVVNIELKTQFRTFKHNFISYSSTDYICYVEYNRMWGNFSFKEKGIQINKPIDPLVKSNKNKPIRLMVACILVLFVFGLYYKSQDNKGSKVIINTEDVKVPCPVCKRNPENLMDADLIGSQNFVKCWACQNTGYASVSLLMKYYTKQANNNSNIDLRQTKCTDCEGTGRCSSCAGIGLLIQDNIYDMGRHIDKCPICEQSGKCQSCRGKGYIDL